MQEVLFVSSRARKLADSLIVVLAIFLALHQYAPTRALTLVALRRDRSCLLAKIMEGDREARRQILRRADKPAKMYSNGARHEAPEIQPTLVLRLGFSFGLEPWIV